MWLRLILTLKIYKELGAVVPFLREAIGKDIHAISSNDVHLNTGIMKALRAWKPT